MGRSKQKGSGRDGSRFVALPHVVLDSPAYLSLSFSARALLLDLSRQYSGSNNGRLTTCAKVLAPRGWTSHATITKAQRELIEKGFLFVTRQGQRPNKATWFALGWVALDWTPEMYCGRNAFVRGAYLTYQKNTS